MMYNSSDMVHDGQTDGQRDGQIGKVPHREGCHGVQCNGLFCDSWQDFEFLQLNSLLSWAFSWRDKDKNQWNCQWICDI